MQPKKRKGPGAAGGRANEGGSVYRAGLAAYLAAHGLADVPLHVPEARGLGSPRAIALEIAADVDDLACQFEGGDWHIQAKRACRWDAKFRAAVAQCVEAARTLDSKPSIIASGYLTAELAFLRSVLQRSQPQVVVAGERNALRRLRKDADAAGWAADFDVVIARMRVVHLNAENTSDADFREAAALLDGTVVERGAGVAAMQALARFFHTEAASAGVSDVERWLGVLDEARIQPGPTSTSVSAGLARRLAAYRGVLAERLDLLPIGHLAPVPPMPVEGLPDTFRVTLPGAESQSTRSAALPDLARRWPQLAIVGLPGAGKTTAIEQLAALWATDLDAPLPVIVRLHRLIRPLRDGAALTLRDLVAYGDNMSADLVPTVVQRLQEGSAALLLDGLDECREQQHAAAVRIRRLADELHPQAGLVASARVAASADLVATGLPVITLDEPRHLASRLQSLAHHVAAAAGGSDPDEARAWVERSQAEHPDVWRIPLFGVLLAVHAARTPPGQRAATRAHALVAAVEDSVLQWEQFKAHEPAAWGPELHPTLLLSAFVEVAHLVVVGGCDEPTAIAAIASVAAEGWGLAPVAAQASATDAMRWWIDRVGAFTVDEGDLRARLRMLAEIGDAMWAIRQPTDARRSWVNQALSDPERSREPLLLAASLKTDMLDDIADAADTPRAVLLATECAREARSARPQTLALLLDRLDSLAERGERPPPRVRKGTVLDDLKSSDDRRHDDYDGPAWRYLYAAASLPLPPEFRGRRDTILGRARDEEQHLVAASIAAAADCRMDERQPTEAERIALLDLLALPVPERGEGLRKTTRRRFVIAPSQPILTGRGAAAASAIALVGLDDHTAPLAVELALRVPHFAADQLHRAIASAGYGSMLADRFGFAEVFAGLARHFGPDGHRADRFIVDTVIAAAAVDPALNPHRIWRLNRLANAFYTLQSGEAQIGVPDMAVERHPALVARLVRMAMRDDAAAIAAEARLVKPMIAEDPLGTVVLLHLSPSPRAAVRDTLQVQAEDFSVLDACLKSGNDWLFWTAVECLTDSERGRDLIWIALPNLAVRHRFAIASWLLEATDRVHVASSWATGDDPVLRVAAARVTAKHAVQLDEARHFLTDPDVTVRVAALEAFVKAKPDQIDAAVEAGTASPPTCWTCTDCGSVEGIQDLDCTSCSTGSHDELREVVDKLRKRHGLAAST